MEELRPGLWTWTGEHPEWTPEMTVTDRATFEASLGV